MKKIGFIAQKENLETPEIFKYLKNLYFLFQVLKDSIYISQKMILTV